MLEELKDLIAQKNNQRKIEDDTSLNEIEKIIRKCMDMKVWNQLHEHQREGVKFLIERLLSDHLPNQLTSSKPSNHEVRSETGAILADGMGTGKTLIGLVTTRILCKHLSCKAVIVCPSNLVTNWEREVNQWFPTAKVIIVGAKSKTVKVMDQEVNAFVTQHALLCPLLVISYELYRIYANALNTISSLQILLCDEGHRYLKNLTTTKTGVALFNSIATRRMIFTGTIIQNNLKELYQMIHFVIPNYFQPFLNNCSSSSSVKSSRRGETETVTSSLSLSLDDPFLLFKREFIDVITEGMKEGEHSNEEIRLAGRRQEKRLLDLLSRIILRRHQKHILRSILPPCTSYLLLLPLLPKEDKVYKQLIDTATERSAESRNMSQILAKLTELRVFLSAGQLVPSDSTATPAFFSTKLQVCAAIIKASLTSSPMKQKEKVVVVSSYLTTLDAVKAVCQKNNWQCLRIDGSVTSERRYKILDYFNHSDSNFNILLLSSRTGGVGISLVGASRMILMEPDWNPANDEQAMGRLWRQGQKRAVTIYRLGYRQSMEEFIFLQQNQKNQLNRVIHEQGSFFSFSSEEKLEALDLKRKKRVKNIEDDEEMEEDEIDEESEEDHIRKVIEDEEEVTSDHDLDEVSAITSSKQSSKRRKAENGRMNVRDDVNSQPKKKREISSKLKSIIQPLNSAAVLQEILGEEEILSPTCSTSFLSLIALNEMTESVRSQILVIQERR